MESTDFVTNAQKCIEQLFGEIQAIFQTNTQLKIVKITDANKRHYLLLLHGRMPERSYEHSLLIHLLIKEDEIVILQNNTEYAISDDLVEKGIARESIIIPYLTDETTFVEAY